MPRGGTITAGHKYGDDSGYGPGSERPTITGEASHVHEDTAPAAYEETVVDEGRPWYVTDVASRVNAILATVVLAVEGLLALRALFPRLYGTGHGRYERRVTHG